MKPRFRDRSEAGQLLAAELRKYAGHTGVLVLGLARGGLPVAREIAGRLGAPLNVLVVRKLAVPCREELAMGAIAPGGVCVLNEDLIEMLDIGGDAIGAVRLQEERKLDQREQLYRELVPAADLQGKTAIVVDDGIATGVTMRAAVIHLRRENAAKIVIAAPVIAKDSLRELTRIADEVATIEMPEQLSSVGQWYEEFPPTTDDEVRHLLEISETPSTASAP